MLDKMIRIKFLPRYIDFSCLVFKVCIAEALYDVDSIVADPGAYTKEELASLHSQVLPNLEQAWELSGGSEDQLIPGILN